MHCPECPRRLADRRSAHQRTRLARWRRPQKGPRRSCWDEDARMIRLPGAHSSPGAMLTWKRASEPADSQHVCRISAAGHHHLFPTTLHVRSQTSTPSQLFMSSLQVSSVKQTVSVIAMNGRGPFESVLSCALHRLKSLGNPSRTGWQECSLMLVGIREM